MLTNQEIFDKVLTHLRKQGRRSRDELKGCLYRGPNGDMCAVGCLIPDEQYQPSFDRGGANTSIDAILDSDGGLVIKKALQAGGVDAVGARHLLKSLQVAHDTSDYWGFLPQFEEKMRIVASKFDLAYAPPTQPPVTPVSPTAPDTPTGWVTALLSGRFEDHFKGETK